MTTIGKPYEPATEPRFVVTYDAQIHVYVDENGRVQNEVVVDVPFYDDGPDVRDLSKPWPHSEVDHDVLDDDGEYLRERLIDITVNRVPGDFTYPTREVTA